jgi:hypothetical protein
MSRALYGKLGVDAMSYVANTLTTFASRGSYADGALRPARGRRMDNAVSSYVQTGRVREARRPRGTTSPRGGFFHGKAAIGETT